MDKERTKFLTGVTVFVVKNKQLLLGLRKNIPGDGMWGLPGGHLEYKESMLDAAARELNEETGLKAQSLNFIGIVNNITRPDDNHYIQIGFLAEGISEEIQNKEPDKCGEWKFFALNKLPKNIFYGHAKLIEDFVKGVNFGED